MNRFGKQKHKYEVGIEAARKKRLAQVHEKAKMLREYAKLAKREGIQSERVNLNQQPKSDDRMDNKNKSNHSFKKKKIVDSTNSKTDLIKLYNDKQKEIKSDNEVKNNEQTTKLDAIKAAKATREKERKDRFKRTKKGQPILGNQMVSLLSKIKSTIHET